MMFFYKLPEEEIMKLHRIQAIFLQEFFIFLHAMEYMMDIVVYPLMSVVVFGFLSLYLIGNSSTHIGQSVVMGMILWQIIFITQYSIPVGSLWNIWSRNLSNLFITPLQIKEYLFAQTISAITKSLLVLVLNSIICFFVFHFNILSLGIVVLLAICINFILFAFSMGVIITGLIFRFSTRIQSLAWGFLPILQPLMAAIYPISVLPKPLQYLSYLFPPTFSFEAARIALFSHTISWSLFGLSFGENCIYVIFAILFFKKMFNASKDTGQFARNEA